MAQTIEFHGYHVRLRLRVTRIRKRVNGRARGFYGENTYVYARVIGPDGVLRDLLLGSTTRSTIARYGRVKKAAKSRTSSSPPAKNSRGKSRGHKDDAADTRDPHDDRTLNMFEVHGGETRWSKQHVIARAKR